MVLAGARRDSRRVRRQRPSSVGRRHVDDGDGHRSTTCSADDRGRNRHVGDCDLRATSIAADDDRRAAAFAVDHGDQRYAARSHGAARTPERANRADEAGRQSGETAARPRP
jgi:hypothetical protein